jgi:hypothetical protein
MYWRHRNHNPAANGAATVSAASRLRITAESRIDRPATDYSLSQDWERAGVRVPESTTVPGKVRRESGVFRLGRYTVRNCPRSARCHLRRRSSNRGQTTASIAPETVYLIPAPAPCAPSIRQNDYCPAHNPYPWSRNPIGRNTDWAISPRGMPRVADADACLIRSPDRR